MSTAEKRKYAGHADEEVQGTVATGGDSNQQMVLSKKARTEDSTSGSTALVAQQAGAGALIVADSANAAPPRTSTLQAATMKLTGHGAAVYAARFNATGGLLASGGGDKLLFLWEVAGECRNTHVFTGHDGPVLDLAWGRDSALLFTASADKTAAVWDVATGERVKRIRGHGGVVNSVAATRRGEEMIVTGSDDCSGQDIFKHSRSGAQWRGLDRSLAPFCVDPLTGGCVIALRPLCLCRGSEPVGPARAPARVDLPRQLPNFGDVLQRRRHADLQRRNVGRHVATRHDARARHRMLPAGRGGAERSKRSQVDTRATESRRPRLERVDGPSSQCSAAGLPADPSSRVCCRRCSSSSNDVKVWDVRTQRLVMSLAGHRDSVTGLSLSPDGSYLLSNSMDNTLRCWDVRPFVAGGSQGQRQTAVYKAHSHDLEQSLLRCAWSPDGLRVAAGSADRTVNIWEASSGRVLYRLPGHKGSVNDVAFHPTEPIIASASSDKTIFLGEF